MDDGKNCWMGWEVRCKIKIFDNFLKILYSIFKEGRHFIAYTNALDLSTSGKTYAEVKQRFDEAVKIFFEEIIEKNTFKEVLRELGWRKIHKEWSPPPVVAHEAEEIRIPLTFPG